ncbi:MAG: hypothetical protein SF028_05020 [Candidatus Sumerlaeia bacterium]|nr:hypothetical protein [Candidatus Sumerlaeia bacterium]
MRFIPALLFGTLLTFLLAIGPTLVWARAVLLAREYAARDEHRATPKPMDEWFFGRLRKLLRPWVLYPGSFWLAANAMIALDSTDLWPLLALNLYAAWILAVSVLGALAAVRRAPSGLHWGVLGAQGCAIASAGVATATFLYVLAAVYLELSDIPVYVWIGVYVLLTARVVAFALRKTEARRRELGDAWYGVE